MGAVRQLRISACNLGLSQVLGGSTMDESAEALAKPKSDQVQALQGMIGACKRSSD